MKIRKEFKIDYMLDWEYSVNISEIKKDIEELEKLGATSINIQIEYDYGEASLEIKAVSLRQETDEEYKQRIDAENENQKKIEKRELEQLNRLKEKYEKLK